MGEFKNCSNRCGVFVVVEEGKAKLNCLIFLLFFYFYLNLFFFYFFLFCKLNKQL